MKILEANAGPLTNFEVLDFLRAKGASKDRTRVIANVAQSEYKVYDYLVNTAAAVQTKENVKEFLTSVKQYDLAKAEVLNLINIGPAAAAKIYPIIEEYDERFPVAASSEIVVCSEIAELVNKSFPRPPVEKNPEEVTKGDGETSTLEQDKGSEISQDQTESREEMDTS